MARRAFAASVALGLLAACTGGTKDTESAPRTALEAAEAIVERRIAPGEENGLEVVTWSVANREAAIRRTFARYAIRGVRLGTTPERLERLGLRAVVVRTDDLPRVLAELGGTSSAMSTWHGQVTAWREIARASLESSRATMVDGRAEVLGAGWLRLMTRAWTVELEDGLVLDVQLAPQWVGNANDLSGITNRDTLRGRVFSEAAIAVELPPNTALLVVASPARFEEEPDPEGPPGALPSTRTAGPPAELPETPGELLLTDRAAVPPRRVVLVLRARLPDILLAEPTPTAPAGLEAPGGIDSVGEPQT